jgi:hypothetical protein
MSQAGSFSGSNPIQTNIARFRSYGELHRDFWRLIAKNPLVFIVFPALIFVPSDLIIAFATQGMDTLESLRMSTRIQQIASLVLGTFAASTMIWTLKEMANGQHPSFGASLIGGKNYWRVISITTFQIGWRVGLATLLLIVPGVILAVRYCFALPITVFEDIHGKPALVRSKETGAGVQWALFLPFLFSVMIYLPIVFALLFSLGHLAEQAGLGLWAEVVSSIPVNIAFAFMTIGTTVLFLEVKHPERFQSMLMNASSLDKNSSHHKPLPSSSVASGLSMSGVYPFLLGAVAWVGAGFFLVSYFGLGFFQIVAGNYYAEKGDLEKSRHYFQRAVEIEPEHPDYRFALGNQYLHADRDFEKAILEYKKVVSLDPKHGEAHLALATSYYFLGDFATAKKYLATAETLPLESTDLLTTLKEDENMLP